MEIIWQVAKKVTIEVDSMCEEKDSVPAKDVKGLWDPRQCVISQLVHCLLSSLCELAHCVTPLGGGGGQFICITIVTACDYGCGC